MSKSYKIKFQLISLLIVLLLSNAAFGQKKKELRNASINSKKEWNYVYSDEGEKKYLEAEYSYDKSGNIMLEKKYDENGNTILHKEYKYNSEGNEVEETTYNPKGQVIERVETKYFKDDLKLEKKVFGPNGKLKSKKVFEYKTF
jgi:hypothetical protein